jgi:hypothetical protein
MNQLKRVVDMWMQGNMTQSSLTMRSLVGSAPIGAVWASGPDVTPLVAAVAALAHVDV